MKTTVENEGNNRNDKNILILKTTTQNEGDNRK